MLFIFIGPSFFVFAPSVLPGWIWLGGTAIVLFIIGLGLLAGRLVLAALFDPNAEALEVRKQLGRERVEKDDPLVDAAVGAAWELKMALRKALALENRGEFAAAIKQFELVAQKAGEGHPSAVMAQERIQQLQTKAQAISAEPPSGQEGQ
jgi:hypothetical protein